MVSSINHYFKNIWHHQHLAIAGFSALAFQLLSLKLIHLAGLGDAISVAISLTAFVSLSGIGALIAEKITRNRAPLIEILLGMYALVVFGIIGIQGPEAYIDLWSDMSRTQTIGLIVAILSPMAVGSGAIVPAYEESHNEGTNFGVLYFLFHIGGAASLLLLELYLMPMAGWAMIGVVYGSVLIGNGLKEIKGWVVPGHPDKDPERKSWSVSYLWLAILGVITGYAGVMSYSAVDYIIGPHIKNYAIVTAGVFLGLGVSVWVARSVRTIWHIVALTGLGLFMVPVMAYLSVITINALFGAMPQLPFWGVVSTVVIVLNGIVVYSLIGVSIPGAARIGLDGGKALFVVSIANALGYWLYIGTAAFEMDLVIVTALATVLLICSNIVPAMMAPGLLIIFMGFFEPEETLSPVLNQNILMKHYEVLEETNGWDAEVGIKESWNRMGWPSEIVTIKSRRKSEYKNEEPVTREKELFHLNGLQSLSVKDKGIVKNAESRASLIPALFARNTDKALVLGAGTGISAGALTSPFNQVDIVDISPNTEEQLAYFNEISDLKSANNVEIIRKDALSYLMSSQDQREDYDLIFSTVTGSGHAFSASLYTKEFFHKAHEKLTPGGVFSFWMDYRTPAKSASMILKAFKESFKNVRVIRVHPKTRYLNLIGEGKVPYIIVVGSNQSLTPNTPKEGAIVETLRRLSKKASIEPPENGLIDTPGRPWNADRIVSEEITICTPNNLDPASMADFTFAYDYLSRLEKDLKPHNAVMSVNSESESQHQHLCYQDF